jgi:hypothetical protein
MGTVSVVSALVLDVGDAKTGLTVSGIIGIILGLACGLIGNLMIQRTRLAARGPADGMP